MKLAALFALFLLILGCTAVAQEHGAPTQAAGQKSAGFDPKRDAAKDIQNAIAKAKKEHKRVLIDIGGEW